MVLITNSTASVNSVQLQPSHRGRCSGPATRCFSHQLQNVYFYCLAPAYFLFQAGSHAGCINCKQSLGSCECRYQIRVTSTGRCRQTVKKILIEASNQNRAARPVVSVHMWACVVRVHQTILGIMHFFFFFFISNAGTRGLLSQFYSKLLFT